MEKTVTIKLPEWAQRDLEAIKERYFKDRGFNPKEEDIIIEIIANYINLSAQATRFCKIIDIVDEYYGG